MSETPRPLWELVEQMPHAQKMQREVDKDGTEWMSLSHEESSCRRCIWAAALRAWDGQLKDISYVGEEFDIPVEGNWVRQQLLGVPPKEPEKGER